MNDNEQQPGMGVYTYWEQQPTAAAILTEWILRLVILFLPALYLVEKTSTPPKAEEQTIRQEAVSKETVDLLKPRSGSTPGAS